MKGWLAWLALAVAAVRPGMAQECLETVAGLISGNKSKALVLEMLLLATGKTPPFDAGKYEVCRNIEVQSGGALKTRFFIANLASWGVLPIPGEVGLCLPAACKNGDIEEALELLAFKEPIFKGMRLSKYYNGTTWPAPPGTVLYPNPFNEGENLRSWDTGATMSLSITVALIVIAAFSTLLSTRRSRVRALPTTESPEGARAEALLQEGADGGGAAAAATGPPPARRLPRGFGWCEAFALTGKSGSLTTLFKAEAPRPTDCLDGLKVISMFAIVVGHTAMESMNVAGYKNLESVLKSELSFNAFSTDGWMYLILSGQLCVDTFLFISGFLLSFIGKRRPVPVIMGTFLRYARLMPLFGFVMMTYICVVPHLASGPFAPRLQSDVHDNCQGSSWWSQFLFISDWYPWFNMNGGCMGWSWYLSVDMTFAVVGMILLNIWKMSKPAGWAVASLLAVASVGVTLQQAAYYDLDYNVVSPKFAKYAHYLYFRPYTRFPCFFLGLVTPWVLDSMEKRGWTRDAMPSTVLARIFVACLSLVAVGVLALCIWFPMTNTDGAGPSPPARDCSKTPCWSKAENMMWMALSRPLWVLAWTVLTLACYFGYAPCLNKVLAAPVFRPLSALTFGAYLVHPAIIKLIAANETDYYTYSHLGTLGRGVFIFILAYCASLFTWCLVEKPFATMTGWLVPKKKPRQVSCPTPTGTAKPQNNSTPPVHQGLTEDAQSPETCSA